ncbi:hypothetical protein T492DRAFT_120982 [Pavlovales sp. CCMP2436]|nr:hypothetical protein T492DRAFT_120982 [Pavlovales sp. CCMP2436]
MPYACGRSAGPRTNNIESRGIMSTNAGRRHQTQRAAHPGKVVARKQAQPGNCHLLKSCEIVHAGRRGWATRSFECAPTGGLLLERLAADTQEHRREGPRRAALRAADAALLQHLLHLVRPLGREPHGLHDPQHVLGHEHADLCAEGRHEARGTEG